MDRKTRWCLFTSAGDKNVVRLWQEDAPVRCWDLVVAYYGENDREFSELSKISSYAFRSRGGKFQNLKKLFVEYSKFFDHYSYVWVCDDDIRMSADQIQEVFSITETFGFWVAQPAFSPKGKISHSITCYVGPQWDYRIVNYVEVTLPIFRRDKLCEFLSTYDGSLTGWGVELWFINFFKANEFGRFAIIDKVQVINPSDEQKGGREIDRLQLTPLRQSDWYKVREKYGLAEYPHREFAYCKFAPERNLRAEVMLQNSPLHPRLRGAFAVLNTFRRSGWRSAFWLLRCGLLIRRQLRTIRAGAGQ
jgi:hypothetical protein